MATTTADQQRTLRAGTRGRLADPAFAALVTAAGVSVLVILALMIGSTAVDAWPVFVSEGLSFFTSQVWDPGTSRTEITGQYGALAFIYGTVVSAILALVVAVPLATAIALYLNQLAPSAIRRPLVYAVELLAAIPSVVYGLWGALFFVPNFVYPAIEFLAGPLGFLPFIGQPGFLSIASFSVVLSIMILPIITAVSREVIATVPADEKNAAYGLGATRWEVMRHVIIPRARGGIIGASMLGLGRGLGETVAAAFLIGNLEQVNLNIFGPGQTIAAKIALSFGEASPEYVRALIALGVALFGITIIINMLARFITARFEVTGDAAV